MSGWSPKRFWKEANFEAVERGFSVRLDGHPVVTPAKRLLVVPTEKIAVRIVAEWQAQEGTVDPRTMPWTRSANAAIDKVAMQRDEVVDHLATYAATDLLSYRAESPESLVRRQAMLWDPILDWVAHRFEIRLVLTQGLMPVSQDPGSLERLAGTMTHMSNFQLTGFHDLVTLSGSFLIALAAAYQADEASKLFEAACIDETWQAEQWGADEEAEVTKKLKMAAFSHATEFFHAA